MKQKASFDLDQLRIFETVAKDGQFTRAAGTLGMTQSAVSQQVAKLEEQLGQPLFKRTTRRIALTPAGETLLVYARVMTDIAEKARSHLELWPAQGVLRLGIVSDFVTTPLHRVLRIFRQQFPRFALSVQSANSDPLWRALDEGELDLVLVKTRPDAGRGRPLWREAMVWVGDASVVGPPDEPIPLVTYFNPSRSRDAMVRALRAAGETWNVVAENSGPTGIIAGVESGFGVAAFGERFVPPMLSIIGHHERLPNPRRDRIHHRPARSCAKRRYRRLLRHTDERRPGSESASMRDGMGMCDCE